MIRAIEKDESFLQLPSDPAYPEEVWIADDLTDTLAANADRCVGMAANMIGIRKRVIIVSIGDLPVNLVMFNPEIVWCEGPYTTEEGCLSLSGTRKAQRYERIEVTFFDTSWTERRMKFSGWTAEIIQHEIDHLSGILI